MTIKQGIRAVAFLAVTFAMMLLLCDLFEYENSNMSRRYETYKVLEKDTVDAVYVGTSAVDRYWIASKAYDDYGMTVYPLSTEGQPAWMVKPLIQEAYRFQNPQLVIVDVRPFIAGDFSSKVDMTDVRSRRVIDMLDFFSLNRLSAIIRTNTVMSQVDENFSALKSFYYFPCFRYHDKWSDKSFSIKELEKEKSPYLGFFMDGYRPVTRAKVGASKYAKGESELDEISEKYLYELLDFADENDIDLLFADGPEKMTKKDSGRRNAIWAILEERGIPYYTLNTKKVEKDKIFSRVKKTSDFYNNGHVNYYGATKYTDLFAQYLNDNYKLSDHRKDEAVTKDWDDVYKKIQKRIKTLEKKKK